MGEVVVDTHAAIRYIVDPGLLSADAFTALEETATAGDRIFLPSIAIVEVCYLVEKGRLPQTVLDRLTDALQQPNVALTVSPLDQGIAEAVRQIPRDLVPDMPDRIIAATAAHLRLPLVTKDALIRKAPIATIW
jgi:PIN domain nuclease of toxin-antitoxin system